MASTSNGRTQGREDLPDCDMDFLGFDSDIEEPLTPSPASPESSLDYWIGKKLFTYLIAKSSLPNQQAPYSLEDLDV